MPSVNAQEACVNPSPASLDCYFGATTSDEPISFPPSWCSVIHNNHWFAFVADATSASFTFDVYGCAVGNGIQVAAFSTTDCISFNFVSACIGNIPSGGSATLVASPLVPGQTYYICVDGSAGAQCDYSINGVNPSVSGPTTGVCLPSAGTRTYTTNSVSIWSVNPPGAATILGNTTGTQVNVVFNQPGEVQVCAQSLTCPNAPNQCLTINVGEDVMTEETVDLCQGKTVQCAGRTFNQPGSFMVDLPSAGGCDSVVNCIVNLIPTVFVTEEVFLCQGQSVSCAGQEFFGPGTFPVKFSNYQGCDSIVNCKVTLVPIYNSPYTLVNLCGPAEYTVCNETFTQSGLWSATCTNFRGCDSIININLAILNPSAIIAPPAVIDCDSNSVITLDGSASPLNNAIGGITLYTWSGPGILGPKNTPKIQVNQPGQYCLVVAHGRGGLYCYDTTCVTVTAFSALPPLPQISGNLLPCGDSTVLYTAKSNGNPPTTGFNWTTPGDVPYVSIAPDSILITWNSIITGDSLCVTAVNACGLSNPACIPIEVQPILAPVVLSGPDTVCVNGGAFLFTIDTFQTGVSYAWSAPPGAVLTGSGDSVTVDFLNAASGPVCVTAGNNCGTAPAVCINVSVIPTPTAALTGGGEICLGESINLNFTLSGNGPFDVVWTDGLQNYTLNDIANGHTLSLNPAQNTVYYLLNVKDNTTPAACSGIVADTVTVTVRPHAALSKSVEICQGESIQLGGAPQIASGIYVDSLQTIYGCDSIVTTTLTVYRLDTTLIALTTCDPSLAGTTSVRLSQANGCDSLVITTTNLLPTDTLLIFNTSCDSADIGVFVQNLNNRFGCDSTVVTSVTYSSSYTTNLFDFTCDPALAGVFTQNYISTNGCDSIVTTTVDLLPSSMTNVFGQSCNPAEVGVFTKVLNNWYGCDSMVITTIDFFSLDTTYLTAGNCDPALTGVFTKVLTTAQGCDSVLVTTVSLLPSDTTFLFGRSCNPSQVGVFTNSLNNKWGCDSTVITTIDFFRLDTTYLTASSCDPAATGVFTNTLLTSAGCDSVLITTVSLLPSDTTYLFAESCNPALVGVFTNVLNNRWGCDSTVIRTVSLLPSNQVALQSTTCNPADAGVFVYNLSNQFGCDSIVTETVSLLPRDTTYLTSGTCEPGQVGTSFVSLTNQWGCDSTVITQVSLLPASSCSVIITVSGSTIPCGATTGAVSVTATLGEPPFNFSVLQNGVQAAAGTINAIGTPQIVSGLAPGAYTVVVSSANGFSTTAQATIIQLFPPALSASVASDFNGFAVSCAGEQDGSAKATATGGLLPYSFAWSSGANGNQINNIGAGAYKVTVTDGNNCTNTASVTLNEPSPLSFSFTVSDPDCFGQNNGSITANAAGGVPPYRYTLTGRPSQGTNVFTGLAAGTYDVTVTDANDCQQEETIVVNPAVILHVSLGDDQIIALGESALLQAVVNVPEDSIDRVVWTPSFDGTACPQCLTQTAAPFVSTTYSIQVTANNGCRDEDKVIVYVDRRRYVYVPNVFSPNEDGVNDKFSVFAKEGTVKNIKSLQLFDRWGEAVYDLYNFQPNDPNIGWDGRFRNQPMNPGVYVWVLEVEFIDGVTEVYSGDVMVQR
jgi:gliding motility-associated-like protein